MAKDTSPTPEDLGLQLNDTEEVEKQNENPSSETASDNGPAPKRRGRPPKGDSSANGPGRPKKTSTRKAESAEALAQQILGLHQIAALATGLQECVISPVEALMLAKGLNSVAEEYGLSLSGKTGAAFQLFGAAAIVYGPRILSVRSKMAEAKAAQNRTVDMGSVVPIDPNAPYAATN